jgi:Toprim domain
MSKVAALAVSCGIVRREGRSYRCECPACKRPTLHISPGADCCPRVYCHYCGGGEPRKALINLGLLDHLEAPGELKIDHEQIEYCRRRYWLTSQPLIGSPAETYLWSREIDVSVLLPGVLDALRYHPRVRHVVEGYLPAMVARSLARYGPAAIHATFIKPDGSGKAGVDPPRQTYGSTSGAAIVMGRPIEGGDFIVGEGIETVLSPMTLAQRTGRYGPNGPPGGAAMSAWGLRNLWLPPSIKRVLIAVDNDADGVDERAAKAAADRWGQEGRLVYITMPRTVGDDWNDVLRGRAAR